MGVHINQSQIHDHVLLHHTVWEVKRSRHGVQIPCTPSLVPKPMHGLVNEVEFLGLITQKR